MTSLFISSNNKIDNNRYRVGSKIEYNGVKLKSASILNNFNNVVGFQVTVNFGGVDIPLTIQDGYYSGDEMAEYLQNKLNQFGNGSQWKVLFNNSAQKFSVQYTNLSTTLLTTLTFNNNSAPFFGVNGGVAIDFPADYTTFIEMPNPTIRTAGFYRIECNDLSTNSMYFEDNPNSGIIGIIPINKGYGEYENFNDSDGFYMTTKTVNDIYNFVNIRIFLGDSNVELSNPHFILVLHFI